jgi:hypothetical protein
VCVPAINDLQLNHLLDALPPAERARIYPRLELVPMPLGMAVYENVSSHPILFFVSGAPVSSSDFVLIRSVERGLSSSDGGREVAWPGMSPGIPSKRGRVTFQHRLKMAAPARPAP